MFNTFMILISICIFYTHCTQIATAMTLESDNFDRIDTDSAPSTTPIDNSLSNLSKSKCSNQSFAFFSAFDADMRLNSLSQHEIVDRRLFEECIQRRTRHHRDLIVLGVDNSLPTENNLSKVKQWTSAMARHLHLSNWLVVSDERWRAPLRQFGIPTCVRPYSIAFESPIHLIYSLQRMGLGCLYTALSNVSIDKNSTMLAVDPLAYPRQLSGGQSQCSVVMHASTGSIYTSASLASLEVSARTLRCSRTTNARAPRSAWYDCFHAILDIEQDECIKICHL